MNYVCTTAIILVILLLIYLIRQPKTLFEGMDYIPLSTSSLKHKTVKSADIADGKYDHINEDSFFMVSSYSNWLEKVSKTFFKSVSNVS